MSAFGANRPTFVDLGSLPESEQKAVLPRNEVPVDKAEQMSAGTGASEERENTRLCPDFMYSSTAKVAAPVGFLALLVVAFGMLTVFEKYEAGYSWEDAAEKSAVPTAIFAAGALALLLLAFAGYRVSQTDCVQDLIARCKGIQDDPDRYHRLSGDVEEPSDAAQSNPTSALNLVTQQQLSGQRSGEQKGLSNADEKVFSQ